MEPWRSLRRTTVRAEIEFPFQQAGAGPAAQFSGKRIAIILWRRIGRHFALPEQALGQKKPTFIAINGRVLARPPPYRDEEQLQDVVVVYERSL